jgi:hypothetical protein
MFIGYIEAYWLRKNMAKNIVRFIWEDVVCRYDVYKVLIVDSGPENKKDLIRLNHCL